MNIKFTRNLPDSLVPNTPSDLMEYRGLVSDRTLLEQIPFVDNVDDEIAEVQQQKEDNMSLYNFPVNEEEDEEESAES